MAVQTEQVPHHIVIIGGGAGGLELQPNPKNYRTIEIWDIQKILKTKSQKL